MYFCLHNFQRQVQRDSQAIIVQERLKVSNMVEVIGGNYAVKHLPCFCQRAFEMEETLGIVMIKETGSVRDCESSTFLQLNLGSIPL